MCSLCRSNKRPFNPFLDQAKKIMIEVNCVYRLVFIKFLDRTEKNINRINY